MIILLQSSPKGSQAYEQGLEIAMSYGDFFEDNNIKVVISGEFLQAVLSSNMQDVFIKKLKQLELFEIKTFSLTKTDYSFIATISNQQLREMLINDNKVLSF